MEKRIAPFAICFVLLAACGAACQNTGESLPDAPSAQIADRVQEVTGFEGQRALAFGAAGGFESGMTKKGLTTPDKAIPTDSRNVFNRYLYPSLIRQRSGYRSSGGGSLMGRATYAASRIFVTRDETGKGRLNTSYFLRALTSVAAQTASRPYWRRSAGQPLSDFGSTMGNDAGMNVLHEFAPNLQHVMASHAPRFVSSIAERIGR